jgi:hypothetical protein
MRQRECSTFILTQNITIKSTLSIGYDKRFKPILQGISKSKAVPPHAMEAHGGRGGIAPTHS